MDDLFSFMLQEHASKTINSEPTAYGQLKTVLYALDGISAKANSVSPLIRYKLSFFIKRRVKSTSHYIYASHLLVGTMQI